MAKDTDVVEETDTEQQEQSVSLFLAIGMVVGALIVGLVIGYAAAPKEAMDVGLTGAPNVGTAPALDPDQLEAGKLPSGHPPIPAAEGATGTPAATGTPGSSTDPGAAGSQAAPGDSGAASDDGATDQGSGDGTGDQSGSGPGDQSGDGDGNSGSDN